MKLIVGLGNPGKKYEKTRHNIGFIFCDMLVEEYGGTYQKKFNGLLARIKVDGVDTYVLKPQTFMNLSGTSIYQTAKYFQIKTDNILMIYDDLDMPFGKIKTKYDSSAGGHNGMKDTISKMKTQKINRIKIGITNENKKNGADFVLGVFNKSEFAQLPELYNEVKVKILDFLNK